MLSVSEEHSVNTSTPVNRQGKPFKVLPAKAPVPKLNISLFPEEPVHEEGCIKISARLEFPYGTSESLWYKVPEEFSQMLTDSADPLVIGSIFLAMAKNANLRVHGRVSPSLLTNLCYFQNAWAAWQPKTFQRVDMSAAEEGESAAAKPEGRSICCFSGGLDSLFTISRHTSVPLGRQQKNINAALLIHGFDIALADDHGFQKRSAHCKKLLGSMEVPLITTATNFKDINPDWNYSHGAGVASCLSLFQNSFGEGIIPGTYDYTKLLLPWGSNPITDPMLSSQAFPIFHDAGHWKRATKLKGLSKANPDAYDNMVVCYSNAAKDQNCCRCYKCVLTMILCMAEELPPSKAFPAKLTPESIKAMRDLDEHLLFGSEELVRWLPKAKGVPQPLGLALKQCVKFNLRRLALERYKKTALFVPWADSLQRVFSAIGMDLPF